MLSRLRTILRNERGATAVEYSVMVVLIAAVIVISVASLGGATSSNIDCTGKSWQNKTSECAAGSSGGSTVSPTPTSGGGSGGGTTGGGTTGGGSTGGTTGGSGNGNGGVGQGNGGGNSKH